jgi:hypothetical protein
VASLFVSTTGTDVTIPELGIVIVHPTTNRELSEQFSEMEIHEAESLTAAIQAGTLTWKNDAAGADQDPANYDRDYLEIMEARTGSGTLTVKELTLAASTIQMFYSSASTLIFTGSTLGQIVRLPVATTVELGRDFSLVNLGTVTATLQYQDGTFISLLPANSRTVVSLVGDDTANGTWFILQQFNDVASGIVNYNVIDSTAFTTNSITDVIITGFTVTPIAGKYAVWFNASASGTQGAANHFYTIYRGGVAIADSLRSIRPGASNTAYPAVTQTIASFDGSQACAIYVRTSAGSMTVNARSLIMIRLGAE